MKRLIWTLLCMASVVHASQPLTTDQEKRVKELIRETLVQNPQILAEAADAYNRQVSEEQQQAVKAVISENKAVLFNDPYSPKIGKSNAAHTLVVFTDYNCPYCKKFDQVLEKLVQNHSDISVIFKFLPYRSESSVTSARDALTVWEQHPEKFQRLNEILMSKKGYHDDASIDSALKKAEVSVSKPSEQSLATVNASLALAEKLGIQGTPATLINDELFPGYLPYEQFEKLVIEKLDTKKH